MLDLCLSGRAHFAKLPLRQFKNRLLVLSREIARAKGKLVTVAIYILQFNQIKAETLSKQTFVLNNTIRIYVRLLCAKAQHPN